MSKKLYELTLQDTVDLLSIKGAQLQAIGEVLNEDDPTRANISSMIERADEVTALNRILKEHLEALPIVPGAALADAE